MNADNIGPIAATVGGGFFGGILIGYALKKVVKLAAVIVGLLFAGLAYLQYRQIIDINWDKLQSASQNTVSTLVNAATQIPFFNGSGDYPSTTYVALTNLGIPITGSVTMGFAVGFIKG
jgi:uncharacterized membrane protein (Fun14 family)